jgi:hypothetical protein
VCCVSGSVWIAARIDVDAGTGSRVIWPLLGVCFVKDSCTWNQLVDDTPYAWGHLPHVPQVGGDPTSTGRSASRAAQAQLGHEDSDVTRTHYVHKASVAPDLTWLLERFRPAT